MKNFQHLAVFLLRTGVALAFLYAAIAAFLDPFSWVGFFPDWMTSLFSGIVLLSLWNAYELLLAFWLLSGWKPLWSGTVASFSLLIIILPNLTALDIVFRDIAIFCAALALTLLNYPQGRRW